MSQPTQTSRAPSLPRLWASWFIAIVAWALQLFISYAFVEWVCQNPETLEEATARWLLNGLTLLCFGVAVFGTWLAYSLARLTQDSGTDAAQSRRRFMALGGSMLSGFLSAAILVQGWPNLVLPLCSN